MGITDSNGINLHSKGGECEMTMELLEKTQSFVIGAIATGKISKEFKLKLA